MKISIILPTYNEVDNIVDLIRAIDVAVKDEKECVVVDDNSPDGTSQAVQKLIESNTVPNVRLITRTHDRGLTKSLQEGIWNARGEIVVWMDCDFSMPPEIIPLLLAKVDEGYDAAVGSRFVEGGSFKKDTTGTQDSWLAVVLSRLMNLSIRLLLGFPFRDYTSGFIAIKKSVLDRVPLRGDYGEYFIDMIFRVMLMGYRVIEIPYVCVPRRKGESKTGSNLLDYLKRGVKYIVVAIRLLTLRMRRG